jgi:hypothetical protein
MWSLQKILFFTFKLSYLMSTHKTETGIANRWWTTTDSKPPRPIIMMNQSEIIVSSSQIIFITLFPASPPQHCYVFYEPATQCKLCNYAESKPFSFSKTPHISAFLHPILMCSMTLWAPPQLLSEHKNRPRVKQQPPEHDARWCVWTGNTFSLYTCPIANHGGYLCTTCIYLPSSLQVCSILTYVHSNI